MKQGTALRTAICSAFGTIFDGGKLRLYTGSAPATPNDSATGTLLAEITLESPAFASASSGAISKSSGWVGVGLDDGTVGWARMLSSDNSKVLDLTVGLAASDIIMDDLDVLTGDSVAVATFTYAQAES